MVAYKVPEVIYWYAWSHGLLKKIASMTVPPAPIRVPTNVHFPRMLRQSRLSANDKGDNKMIPGTVHRSPDIYLKAEVNHGKPQLGDFQSLCYQSSHAMGSFSYE